VSLYSVSLADRESRISGSTYWNQMDCTIPALGLHTLEWRYVKDGGVSDGNDCGWVDQVEVWGDWGEWWIEIQ